ncbi:hypothetical protein J21TS7_23540 [Paenibacillus cineris]|uniref:Uncharacterized protein n=1 Tax=Paenibacillus cineris TaxID=237530 RepID=A0ABQ4LCA0_9BACL|nr:hypothetical protein J21TS7_23540 [Paenibacillus cineris]
MVHQYTFLLWSEQLEKFGKREISNISGITDEQKIRKTSIDVPSKKIDRV